MGLGGLLGAAPFPPCPHTLSPLTSSRQCGVGAVAGSRRGQALAVAVGPPQRGDAGRGHRVVQGQLVWGQSRGGGLRGAQSPSCSPHTTLSLGTHLPSTGGMFGEGAGGGRALPALLRGDPRASPSPSCTCTLPMSPSMCSEGPWPGCFSRSVSVLEGAEGRQAVPRCLHPPSHPAVPPPAPRHVQRGHFEAGHTPRRGWARGARAAAGRRLRRWLWRTRCRSRRPPGTRQHETLNAITQGTALPRSASHTSLCGWAAPRGCGVALLGELQKPPGRGPGQPAPGPAGAGGLQPRLPTSAVT